MNMMRRKLEFSNSKLVFGFDSSESVCFLKEFNAARVRTTPTSTKDCTRLKLKAHARLLAERCHVIQRALHYCSNTF